MRLRHESTAISAPAVAACAATTASATRRRRRRSGPMRWSMAARSLGLPAASNGRRASSLRHQDLRKGSGREALLVDDVQLQVLFQFGEWAAARADGDRDRRQLVFVDEA